MTPLARSDLFPIDAPLVRRGSERLDFASQDHEVGRRARLAKWNPQRKQFLSGCLGPKHGRPPPSRRV